MPFDAWGIGSSVMVWGSEGVGTRLPILTRPRPRTSRSIRQWVVKDPQGMGTGSWRWDVVACQSLTWLKAGVWFRFPGGCLGGAETQSPKPKAQEHLPGDFRFRRVRAE